MSELVSVLFSTRLIPRFLQGTVYKTVLGIHYGRLAVLMRVFHHLRSGLVTCCHYPVVVGE